MRKPASLRDAIATLMVGLGQNPDKLAVAVADGRIVATKASSASFEYRYLVDVLVQDFDGDVDYLFIAVMAWVRQYQDDLLANYMEYTNYNESHGITYSVIPLTNTTCDISIKLNLTESIVAALDPNNPRVITVTPPKPYRLPQDECWEMWLKDQKLATWTTKPMGWPTV